MEKKDWENFKPLFQQAFTHSSFVNENKEKKISDYETLEFLGDSILGMYVCLYIYQNYPHYSEGEMSKLKQFMVQESTLAQLSEGIGLGKYLKLGKGTKQNSSILADVFESFIAALYLEKGAKTVELFLTSTLFTWIKGKEDQVWDYKTQLQEICQAKKDHLEYTVVKWRDKKENLFTVEARLGKLCVQGKGKSIKDAEQEAARCALEKIEKKDS
ncbi:ribonuclease III [endosymbiont GvMRE of Glomus versiforme]|uniref:ribonuclease III n=1 Tax=endosymbiont GvMRE of Glomus versiforme TaxID=2039283 RepID=UPI000ECD3B7C|nr:ribonuclease III [endosymbiont GvMRE of Glomus versiforme]RHZ36509.1 Ribonuclease 3 [endosymbiont GvMRE of Glomus versiforme]